MKLNEVLPEFIAGRATIRREIWDTDEYLKYDIVSGIARTSGGQIKYFTVGDVMTEDWTFIETLEQKKLEMLFEVLNAFHSTEGLDARAYKDDLLRILRAE